MSGAPARASARARPFQRAGRPHGGDQREAADEPPRRPGAEFGFVAPRRHGHKCSPASAPCSTGHPKPLSGSGQLRPRDAGHRPGRQGPRLLRPHRPHRDEAQPLAPRAGTRRLPAPLPRPHRDRPEREGQDPDRHGRGFHEHGPRLGRDQQAGLARTALRDRHHRRQWPPRRWAPSGWIGRRSPTITTASATSSSARSRVQRLQPARRRPRGFMLRNLAAERIFETPTGRANFSAGPLPEATEHQRAKRATDTFVLQTFRSHDQYNTTIYGLDDRYRGVYGERRVVFAHPRGSGRDPRADRRPGRHRRHPRGRRDAVAEDFRLVPFDMPRGSLAGYYPSSTCWCPSRPSARAATRRPRRSILVSLRAPVAA